MLGNGPNLDGVLKRLSLYVEVLDLRLRGEREQLERGMSMAE